MAYAEKPIRRSALIGPWGIGAIVPFPNDESLMIAGLDAWRYQNEKAFIIEDERLVQRLGVKELRWPPDFREKNADRVNCNLKIPTVRFPRWHYCPFCGYMEQATYYQKQPECIRPQWKTGRVCSQNGKYRRKMIPERFIVVCPEGHIDDFPVAEWIHHDSGHVYDKDTCKIRRSTGGASANLTGVFYECTCGAKKSMAGATTKGALGRIGYYCKGAKPWLGIYSENTCQRGAKDIKVMLRGATNVWFADTKSSIYIPTENKTITRKIAGVIRKNYDSLNSRRVNGEFNRDIIDYLAETERIDPDTLYQAFLSEADKRENIMDVSENMSEDQYRQAEYKILIRTSGSDGQYFHSINHPIAEYDKIIRKYFKSISLVPKLKETRAMVGFSRLEPNEKPLAEKKKELRLGNENWLPAIEVFGEGIFFEFSKQMLEQWAQNKAVKLRIEMLNESYHKSNFGKRVQGDLRPEFVLIHTFAHLIINQLSFECGYGSSSLRERIYCEKTSNELDMCGVLIYTASGDSEGSLGGLVRQGEAGRLEDTIVNAIHNALWCTSDPICIQSWGQGPESLNLSACHNCALLPETCCENGNRLLDRGVVVGTLEEADMGLFNDLKYI